MHCLSKIKITPGTSGKSVECTQSHTSENIVKNICFLKTKQVKEPIQTDWMGMESSKPEVVQIVCNKRQETEDIKLFLLKEAKGSYTISMAAMRGKMWSDGSAFYILGSAATREFASLDTQMQVSEKDSNNTKSSFF